MSAEPGAPAEAQSPDEPDQPATNRFVSSNADLSDMHPFFHSLDDDLRASTSNIEAKEWADKQAQQWIDTNTYQVTTPHFCAGAIFNGYECVEAAPIIRWMVGKDFYEIDAYCKRNKWKIILLGSRNRSIPRRRICRSK